MRDADLLADLSFRVLPERDLHVQPRHLDFGLRLRRRRLPDVHRFSGLSEWPMRDADLLADLSHRVLPERDLYVQPRQHDFGLRLGRRRLPDVHRQPDLPEWPMRLLWVVLGQVRRH
jgi:hypothetical protein